MGASSKTSLETMDIMKIMELLPHRYPFLMIDRVIDIDSDNSAIGIKTVTINEPHFQGHFPDKPVMPGVLIIEAMAQTAGCICINSDNGPDTAPLVYFMTIEKAKFRKPVIPGDVLEIHVKKLKNRSNIWKFAGEGIVAGDKVAEAEISAMIISGEE